jgi:hypothetical protein
VNHPLSLLLREAAARLRVPTTSVSLLDGEWQLRIPLAQQDSKISITNGEARVPSWRAVQGLENYADEKRASEVVIEVSDEVSALVCCFRVTPSSACAH